MKSVIFIAPPAAGKGTQSSFLETLGYVHISTGDMLRSEIASGSDFGKEINELITKGLLVSDDIVIKLIENKLSNIGDTPFILDGFPRTLIQAESLDEMFKKLNISNYVAIYLSLDMDNALKRALGRLTCKCGRSYNIYYDDLKPKVLGICDSCKSELTKRNDDNEESFKQRFETYLTNADPIIEFYKNKGNLVNVDASVDSNMVTEEIKEIIK